MRRDHAFVAVTRAALGSWLFRLRTLLTLWGAREFERSWLASLSDAQLRDMRMDRRQVREEAAKPFWKA